MRKRLIFPLLLLLALTFAPPLAARDYGIESLRQTGKAFAAVARQVAPSVVFIQVEERSRPAAEDFNQGLLFGDDLFRRFFGDDFPGLSARPGSSRRHKVISQGSGFAFATGQGGTYILTNSHVLENAEKISVKLPDGRVLDARIKGTDPKSDVAVLEIPGHGLPVLAWGDSGQLEVGEWVVAMGNPFGLSNTLTVGVVSAKGRTSLGINDYEDFIQTDAAINPGNSGGPLLNLDGEVVGMNTAIFSRSGGYMGVGFAIPSNLARNIAEQLVAHGRVVRGYLGVGVQPLTQEIADAFGLKEYQGVQVAQVGEASPAARAGLKPGDLLLSLDGVPISDGGQYRNLAALARPGSTVTLGIMRAGRRQDLQARVGRLDEALAAAASEQLGLMVRDLTPDLNARLRLKSGQGVVVTEVAPDSVAALAGLRPGMVILEVDREPVGNADDFVRALEKRASDGQLLLRIAENGQSRYLMLSWR